jgi:Uma2 family endonuclease
MPHTATLDQLLETADQRVYFRNLPWASYEAMLALRGDAPFPRMTYLRGVLELMSPSKGHESTKKTLARLVEAYADEIGQDLWAYGSWTLKSAPEERGAEADECYSIGKAETRGMPDLAIEVAWTRGGIDKREVYRKLGVRELWFWEDGAIAVFELRGESYAKVAQSLAFPRLDLALVARLATHANPSEAVRELRAWVRSLPS